MDQTIPIKKIGFTNLLTASFQIAILLLALYFTSLHSYLLFHTIVEMTGVVIMAVIFLIVWNARRYIDNGFFVLLGISLVFIAGTMILHTLSYKGMHIFHDDDANLPTQLWIAGRYLMAGTFFLAPLFIKRKFDIPLTIITYALIFVFIILSIFYWKNFPVTYIQGVGLTHFKTDSEYIIAFLFAVSAMFINIHKENFDRRTRRLIVGSLIFSIVSELFFSEYVSVYEATNLIGHLTLIISYYFLYLGIIEIALRRPSLNFYRNLILSRTAIKNSEEKLRKMNEILEEKVLSRTFDLKQINEKLNARNLLLKLATLHSSRKKYLNELVKLLKTWSGCSSVGVRILNESGHIPYNAHFGYSKKFWEKENWLSARKDECVCTRVFRGRTDPQDFKMTSDEGSFYCHNLNEYYSDLTNDEKKRFRGTCSQQGYVSLGVVPIWHGKKIMGVVHLADREKNKITREKIEFIENLSPLIGSAIHKYNTLDSLEKSKRALSVLSDGNHILIHARNEKELLNNVTQMIVNKGGYAIAWIGYINKTNRMVEAAAQAGIEKEKLNEIIRSLSTSGNIKGSAMEVIGNGKVRIRQNIQEDPEYSYLRKNAIIYKFKSSICLPLKNNGSIFGALTIYAKESVAFDKNEIKLLEELANDMAYGINALRTRVAKERSEHQLLESYNHLGMLNRKISVLLDLDKTARVKKDAGSYILETAINLSQADLGLLYKYNDEEEGRFSLLSYRGVGKKLGDELRNFSNEAHKFLSLLVKRQSIMEVRSDIYKLGCFNINNKVRCYLIIPLLKRKTGKLKGAIFLGYVNDKKLFNQELEFYNVFERHASSALFNAKVL